MIRLTGADVRFFSFPCGERNVKVSNITSEIINVRFEFDGSDSIIDLLLVCDAIKRCNLSLGLLIMHYVPFSRQDRVMTKGESLSIKVFTDLVNNLEFSRVQILDPHSPVTSALINNCISIPQFANFFGALSCLEKGWIIVAPDAGAIHKSEKLAEVHSENIGGLVHCSKVRQLATGKILKTIVHDYEKVLDKTCVIVDDICDGGRTFIEIAKKLRKHGAKKIILCVSHGFFTKGFKVFDGLIDEIYTPKGRVL